MWLPMARVLMLKLAVDWVDKSTALCVTPSTVNMMVPVKEAAFAPEAATVAVKVTLCPKKDGFRLEDKSVAVAVGGGTMTCESVPVEEELKLRDAARTAVMGWVPTASVELERMALPLESSEPVPMGVAPSKNVTVPAGVANGAEKSAVKLTGVAIRAGFREDASVPCVSSGRIWTG